MFICSRGICAKHLNEYARVKIGNFFLPGVNYINCSFLTTVLSLKFISPYNNEVAYHYFCCHSLGCISAYAWSWGIVLFIIIFFFRRCARHPVQHVIYFAPLNIVLVHEMAFHIRPIHRFQLATRLKDVQIAQCIAWWLKSLVLHTNVDRTKNI